MHIRLLYVKWYAVRSILLFHCTISCSGEIRIMLEAVCNNWVQLHVFMYVINFTGEKTQMSWGPICKISYDLSYDYLEFVVRSTYDSDLRCAKISLRTILIWFMIAISDDRTFLQVNLTPEKTCALRKMFCKLDVCRKSIITVGIIVRLS